MKNLTMLSLFALLFHYGDRVRFINDFYGDCIGTISDVDRWIDSNPAYSFSEIQCGSGRKVLLIENPKIWVQQSHLTKL